MEQAGGPLYYLRQVLGKTYQVDVDSQDSRRSQSGVLEVTSKSRLGASTLENIFGLSVDLTRYPEEYRRFRKIGPGKMAFDGGADAVLRPYLKAKYNTLIFSGRYGPLASEALLSGSILCLDPSQNVALITQWQRGPSIDEIESLHKSSSDCAAAIEILVSHTAHVEFDGYSEKSPVSPCRDSGFKVEMNRSRDQFLAELSRSLGGE
jgi:hypothetical protein